MRTKKELIEALAERTQQSKKDSEAFLDALADGLRDALAQGNDVVLPGIGKFSVKEKPARTGRNPATGETIQIAARKAPVFSVAKALKDALNNHRLEAGGLELRTESPDTRRLNDASFVQWHPVCPLHPHVISQNSLQISRVHCCSDAATPILQH